MIPFLRFLGILSLTAILLSACTDSPKLAADEFSIHGKLEGGTGKYVFLEKTGQGEAQKLDSFLVAADGSFELHGKTSQPDIFIFYLDKKNFTYLIVAPGEEIQLQASAQSIEKSMQANGSEGTEILMGIKNASRKLSASIDSLKKSLTAGDSALYQVRLDAAKTQADHLIIQFSQYLKTTADHHSESLAAIAALHQRIGNQKVIDFPQNFSLFQKVDSALLSLYPDNYHVKEFHSNFLRQEKTMKQENSGLAAPEIGEQAPDISYPDPSGTSLSLSELKGKYVLLDFWASWCKPCRKESPNLVKAYAKYHAKGFEIFQVSLDKQKENWMKAIQEDQLNWKYHVSDLQYWNSAPAHLYQVSSIPANFLIDPQGKIIARDLRGEQLEQELSKVLR